MEVSRWLVEHNADARAQDKYGWTPLHLEFVIGMSHACLSIVVADVTTRDSERWTPLHEALSRGGAQIAHLLIGCNMDANAKYNDGADTIIPGIGVIS